MSRFNSKLLSPATAAAYEVRWCAWARWCHMHKIDMLLPTGQDIADHIEHMAEAGVAASTLNQSRCAIARRLADHGWADKPGNPGHSQVAKDAVRIATREQGLAGRRAHKALALTKDLLPELLATIDTSTKIGRRDMAMVMLSRDALLRVSELAQARWRDLSGLATGRDGRLKLGPTKNDPTGVGRYRNWLSAETMATVAAVRADRPDAQPGDYIMGVGRDQLARRWQHLGWKAGLKFKGLSSHSARRGMATDLAEAGYTAEQIARVGRWKSTEVAAGYIDESAALLDAVADMYKNDIEDIAARNVQMKATRPTPAE